MTQDAIRTIMEKLHELDKKNEVYQATTIEQLKGINKHLKTLNGKVAKNVERLATQDKNLGELYKEFSNVYTTVSDWKLENRESRKYWFRKVFWWAFTGITTLITAGLLASGVINI